MKGTSIATSQNLAKGTRNNARRIAKGTAIAAANADTPTPSASVLNVKRISLGSSSSFGKCAKGLASEPAPISGKIACNTTNATGTATTRQSPAAAAQPKRSLAAITSRSSWRSP